jgi:hypothetical protein
VVTGSVADSGRRRHARRNGVVAARERLPDVEERGTASEGNAAVGGGIGRRVERDQDGAELQVLGGGRWQKSRARGRGTEELGDSRRKTEDPVVNCRK